MMKRMGLLERNEHRLPMVPATPELEKRLDDVLDAQLSIDLAPCASGLRERRSRGPPAAEIG